MITQVAQTVPASSIVCMAISGCVALLLPVALFFIARKRYRARLLPALIGAGSFLIFALVLERFFHFLMLGNPVVEGFLTSRWWVWGLYGGLAAGLFEESARLCAFYFLLRRGKHNQLGGALAYGIGHGGLEAIVLCSLTMANNIVASAALGSGGVEALAALGFGAQSAAVASMLTSTFPGAFLLSGLERVIAVAFHIAASVLVWLAATGRGSWKLYPLAIGFHTAVNFPAALLSYGIVTNPLLMEGIFAAVTAVVCFTTVRIYEKCIQTYTPLLHYNPSNFGL